MIDLSISLGAEDPRRMTPSQMHAVLTEILPPGSTVYDWEDAVFSAGELVSVPACIGKGELTNVFASRFLLSNINGRVASYSPLATADINFNRALTDASVAAAKSLLVVTSPSANLQGNRQLISTGTANNGLVRLAAGDAWYAAPGWTFYRNGQASGTAAYNVPCLLEATNAANVTNGLAVGSYLTASSWFQWDGPIGLVIVCPTALSAEQRAAVWIIIRRYFLLP